MPSITGSNAVTVSFRARPARTPIKHHERHGAILASYRPGGQGETLRGVEHSARRQYRCADEQTKRKRARTGECQPLFSGLYDGKPKVRQGMAKRADEETEAADARDDHTHVEERPPGNALPGKNQEADEGGYAKENRVGCEENFEADGDAEQQQQPEPVFPPPVDFPPRPAQPGALRRRQRGQSTSGATG
jgi:hypothetical protein